MLGAAIALGLLGLDYAYHRLTQPPPSKLAGATLQIPRTDLGGPVTLVYGWTNVKAPFLCFNDAPSTTTMTDATTGNEWYRVYGENMLFVVGIPMGQGVTHGNRLAGPKLTKVWYGDRLLPIPGGGFPFLDVTTFEGQNVIRETMLGGPGAGGGLIGAYYWYGGWKDQRFDFPASPIGDALEAYAASAGAGSGKFGGLPNQMCVAMCRYIAPGDTYEAITLGDTTSSHSSPVPDTGFSFGENPVIQGISVEVQTYGDRVSDVTHQHIFAMRNEGTDFGGDADPIEVLYDLLVGGVFGKLRLPASLIDTASFLAASTTLKNEGHGYSRAFEEAMPAADMIRDVLRQIDGVFDIDPTTGKLIITLIRNDYDPAGLLEINRTNCSRLENVRITAPTGVPNKVKVTYPDRSRAYAVMPVTAQNLANAVGQDGLVVETVLHYEGVKNAAVAQQIAERELAQVSRSLITCTAYVDGRFRYVRRGDVLKVTWSNPDLATIVFRVADVNRGTLADGTIRLELVQDAFYVWRNRPPVDTGFGGHAIDVTGGLMKG